MTGALIMFGCGLAVFLAAILCDALVAWAIRKWRAAAWDDRS
jgi:hypothetical protein